jgi:hypothetical protein
VVRFTRGRSVLVPTMDTSVVPDSVDAIAGPG